MRISDWSSDMCSSDLQVIFLPLHKIENGCIVLTIFAEVKAPAIGRRAGRFLVCKNRCANLVRISGFGIGHGFKKCFGADIVGQAVAGLRLAVVGCLVGAQELRSEEHTSELQSLMRTSYAVFCLKKKT